MKKIIHCYNSKELLFSLIEFFNDEDSVLIVSSDSKRISPSIINELNSVKINNKNRIFINYMNNRTDFLSKVIRKLKYYVFNIKMACKFAFIEKKLYIFNISSIYELLKFRSEISLLEHGSGTYSDHTKSWKGDKLFNNNFCGGLSSRISYVLLQKPELAHAGISSKTRKYDLGKRYDSLSLTNKKLINDIFSIDLSEKFENVLITGHYSETGYFSENEKIKMYKKIISEFGFSSICIKPHPRETTNYKDFFDCTVIDKFIPFEIFLLNNIKFKNVVTIQSSVGLINSDETTIHILGNEYDNRIYKEKMRREKEREIR